MRLLRKVKILIKRRKKSTSAPELPKSISSDDLLKLPSYEYEGEVTIVRDEKALSEAVKILKKEKYIGFDTETRPSFSRDKSYLPSVIQCAGAKKVFVIQVRHTNGFSPLIPILESEKIIKAGVALRDDIRNLQKIQPFRAHGFVDIGSMAAGAGFLQTGLRNLVAILKQKRISKAARLSNWNRDVLDPRQIKYAATDAVMSREIYFALKKMKKIAGDPNAKLTPKAPIKKPKS